MARARVIGYKSFFTVSHLLAFYATMLLQILDEYADFLSSHLTGALWLVVYIFQWEYGWAIRGVVAANAVLTEWLRPYSHTYPSLNVLTAHTSASVQRFKDYYVAIARGSFSLYERYTNSPGWQAVVRWTPVVLSIMLTAWLVAAVAAPKRPTSKPKIN